MAPAGVLAEREVVWLVVLEAKLLEEVWLAESADELPCSQLPTVCIVVFHAWAMPAFTVSRVVYGSGLSVL